MGTSVPGWLCYRATRKAGTRRRGLSGHLSEFIRFFRFLAYESTFKSVWAFHWQYVDRILRFQSAINRQLFQVMKELERLQDKRKDKPNLI